MLLLWVRSLGKRVRRIHTVLTDDSFRKTEARAPKRKNFVLLTDPVFWGDGRSRSKV